MKDKQFDQFWEIKCPKCNELMNIEILINHFNERGVEKNKKDSH